MSWHRLVRAICSISLLGGLIVSSTIPARAATYYCFTGSYTSGSEVQTFNIRLDDPLTLGEPMSFKTWHYNGDTLYNWAGQNIPGGNFDPTLGLWDAYQGGIRIAYNDDSIVSPPNALDSHILRSYLNDTVAAGDYRLELRSYWGDLHGRGPDWAVDIEGPNDGMKITGTPLNGSTLRGLWLESDNLFNEALINLGSGQSMIFTEDIHVGLNGAGRIELDGGVMQGRKMYIGGDWDWDSDGIGAVIVSGNDARLTLTEGIVVGYDRWAGSSTQYGGYLRVAGGGLVENFSHNEAVIADLPESLGIVEVDATAVDGTRSTWSSSSQIIVGNLGKGWLSISYGGLVTSPGASIAAHAGSANSHVSVLGGDSFSNPAQWNLSGDLYVGGSNAGSGDTGSLYVYSGGYVNVDAPYTLKIWNTGTVELLGGRITTGSFINAGGTFTHTDGTLEVDGGTFDPGVTNYILDGGTAIDLPTVNLLNGATANISGSITVGNFNHGGMDILGGSQVSCTLANIGNEATSTFGSTVSVSGQNSLWTIKEGLNLAAWGNGSLYLTDHGKVELTDPVYGGLQIGIWGVADGLLSVDGKGSQFSYMAGVGIGLNGTGMIQIQNGGELIDKGSYGGRLGFWQLGYGQVIVTGTAAPDDDTPSHWKTAGPIYVGYEGRGELSISGGALVESNGGAIASQPTASDSWVSISGQSAMGTPST
jgi:T5SS/PEP-CTERM-associated repeat protein